MATRKKTKSSLTSGLNRPVRVERRVRDVQRFKTLQEDIAIEMRVMKEQTRRFENRSAHLEAAQAS